jgi:hypothetical protein
VFGRDRSAGSGLYGCYKTECEVECADGFSETVDDKCGDVITAELAAAHGGSGTGHEKKHP